MRFDIIDIPAEAVQKWPQLVTEKLEEKMKDQQTFRGMHQLLQRLCKIPAQEGSVKPAKRTTFAVDSVKMESKLPYSMHQPNCPFKKGREKQMPCKICGRELGEMLRRILIPAYKSKM